MDKIAVIDIGTNTFHLLVVEVAGEDIQVIHKEKISVMLGKGGISEARITDAAQSRALETLKYFKGKIEEYQVGKVFASATSAMRNAINGKEFVQKVLKETDIKINVISGKEEAQFIHKGVKKAMRIGQKPALIMDIGGGSVEFIVCDEQNIFWLESFEIGAQRLLDKFHKHDPISKIDINNLYGYLEEELKPLLNELKNWNPHELIGSSGTFDTLVDMAYARKNKAKPNNNSFSLGLDEFQLLFDEIIHKNREERMAIPGMIEMRVDMIVVAICLIQFLLQHHEFNVIQVSTYALKEGVLEAIIQKEITV
ncbi:exopolyphosphatase [Marivirga sp. S37H4]|uniref:Exopolyphosphatase n=1 Tax=Marivirga aurantiaca TaxID=2802615 RepID=A0A934X2G1_9BACT|nr:exopolyphosphatase [Marivirga aurantiaca]MBK6267246.1 exopolyphosphatase [Marivirga aurantiaca]